MLATAGGAGAHTPGSGGRLEGPPALSEGLQKRGRTLRVDQSLRELLAQLDEDAEPTELSATDLGFDYDAASAPANGLEPNLLASMSGSSRVVGAMERTRLARPGRTEAQHGPVPTKSSGHDKLELNDSELRDFEEGGETVLVNSFSDMGSFRRDTDTFAGLAPSRTAVGAGFAGHRSSDAHPGAGSSSGTYAASHGGVSPSTATAYVDGQTGNLGSNGRASRALDERQATQFVGHNAPRNPLHAEISRLQAANDKLAAHLLETRRALDGALYEKERAVLEVEAEWQTRCEDIKHANDEEFAALRDRIAELGHLVAVNHDDSFPPTDFRAALRQEKELDVLQVRKQIWEQKERQLNELRAQMDRENGQLRRELDERDTEVARLTALLTRTVADFSAQCDAEDSQGAAALLAEVLGEPDGSTLVELVHVATEAFASKEAVIQKQAAELQHLDDCIGAMRDEHETIVRTRTLEIRRDMERQLEQKLEDLSLRHDQEMTEAVSRHLNDVSAMKGHAAEVEALRSALDALERRLAHPKRLDINALQEEYRGEIAELRARWEADGLAKLDQLRRMDAEAAMARWARERDELRRQHDAELAEATMRVKQQCTQAYSSAVSKLKTEYAKLEQVLSGRFQDEIRRRHALWEEEKSELRRNHEMELENALSRARRDPSGELKRRIRYLEDMLAESEGTARGLKDALATSALEHSRAMADLKERAAEDHEAVLRNVKDKYLTTLRSMRDDVAASKQRSLDKLEAEWQRRKERLDAEWGERMAQLRASYEQGREPLRR